jgi:hypothetical protein
MADALTPITPEEEKMRAQFGDAEAYFEVLGRFTTAHQRADLIVKMDEFDSPLAAVYFFRPMHYYIGQLAALKRLLETIEAAGLGHA